MVELSTDVGDSPEESVTFMKIIITLSLSRILKKRKVLGEEHFIKKEIVGLKLDCLDENSEFGCNTVSRVAGACRALHKGYLSKFILLISNSRAEPQSALEAFTWHFTYSEDLEVYFANTSGTKAMTFRYTGVENLKSDLKLLINFVDSVTMHQMEDLPPGCFAGLRLAYNDSKPNNWQAPGFERTDVCYKIQGPTRSITSNYAASTGYHRVFIEVESALLKEKADLELHTPVSSPISAGDDLTLDHIYDRCEADAQEMFEVSRGNALNFSFEQLDKSDNELRPTNTITDDEDNTFITSSIECGMDSKSYYNIRQVYSSDSDSSDSMSAQPPRPRKRTASDYGRTSPVFKRFI